MTEAEKRGRLRRMRLAALPILTYGELKEAVDAINARDRPLALYPFVRDAATRRFLIANTRSGGVSVDAILHVVQHDLPFGGVGPSGMGHYHGREGFDTFSKLRPVFQEGFIYRRCRPSCSRPIPAFPAASSTSWCG